MDAPHVIPAVPKGRIGDTVLRTVASNCTLEMARILVEAGADPTIPRWMMLTALDKSAERKRPKGKKCTGFSWRRPSG